LSTVSTIAAVATFAAFQNSLKISQSAFALWLILCYHILGDNMDLPKRKGTRLQNYDYSQNGACFVTICANNRKNLFGNIISGDVLSPPKNILSPIGDIVNCEILNIEKHYNNIKVDKYIIMPNHIHLLIRITERINPFPTSRYDIPNVIGKFKAAVTRNVGKAFMPSEKIKIWQSSFHDHIIRDEQDYQKIWQYINTNALKWQDDCFYSE